MSVILGLELRGAARERYQNVTDCRSVLDPKRRKPVKANAKYIKTDCYGNPIEDDPKKTEVSYVNIIRQS